MLKILVVEDDPRIQKVLKRLFEAESFSVIGMMDGTSGWEAFRTEKPDAVILDLMLPGANGREVCRRIKQTAAETPVIVLSAVTEVADKVLLLELGCR